LVDEQLVDGLGRQAAHLHRAAELMFHTYDPSVTAQQQEWIEAAIAPLLYDFDRIEAKVTFVTVPEPPCVGHSDYMCTQQLGPEEPWPVTYRVYIREGADDPDAPFNAGVKTRVRLFFQESIVHELGHIVSFTYLNDDASRTTAAAAFTRDGRHGTLADWSPDGSAWGDRVIEAVAEVFKDAFVPRNARVFDNRTNWRIDRAGYAALMHLLVPDFIDEFHNGVWGADLGRWAFPGPNFIIDEVQDPGTDHAVVLLSHQTYVSSGLFGPSPEHIGGAQGYPGPVNAALPAAPPSPAKWDFTATFTLLTDPNPDGHSLADVTIGGEHFIVTNADLQTFNAGDVTEYTAFVRELDGNALAADCLDGVSFPFSLTLYYTPNFGWNPNGNMDAPFNAASIAWTGLHAIPQDAPPYPYDAPTLSAGAPDAGRPRHRRHVLGNDRSGVVIGG